MLRFILVLLGIALLPVDAVSQEFNNEYKIAADARNFLFGLEQSINSSDMSSTQTENYPTISRQCVSDPALLTFTDRLNKLGQSLDRNVKLVLTPSSSVENYQWGQKQNQSRGLLSSSVRERNMMEVQISAISDYGTIFEKAVFLYEPRCFANLRLVEYKVSY